MKKILFILRWYKWFLWDCPPVHQPHRSTHVVLQEVADWYEKEPKQ